MVRLLDIIGVVMVVVAEQMMGAVVVGSRRGTARRCQQSGECDWSWDDWEPECSKCVEEA